MKGEESLIRIKRGTKAEVDALAVQGKLLSGRLFLLTDESRLVVATGTHTYEPLAKESEAGGGFGIGETPASPSPLTTVLTHYPTGVYAAYGAGVPSPLTPTIGMPANSDASGYKLLWMRYASSTSFVLAEGPTRSYLGLLNGSTMTWREIYHQGSILGTVSQSAGIPTGAIIERGSNANGEYVRFADGTQICTHEAAQVSSITAAFGALYISSLLTWTFPASFIGTPRISGFNRYGGGGGTTAFTIGQTASTTSANFYMAGPSSSTNYDQRPVYIAIGRWF